MNIGKLQKLLEGKTVLKIERSNAPESLCKFVLSDGSAFILYATELGFWMTDSGVSNTYLSLDGLMNDYYCHNYRILNKPLPIISVDGDIVSFTAPDDTLFMIDFEKLSEWEKKIVSDPAAIKILAEAANDFGDIWRVLFNPEFGCPKEVCLDKKSALDKEC